MLLLQVHLQSAHTYEKNTPTKYGKLIKVLSFGRSQTLRITEKMNMTDWEILAPKWSVFEFWTRKAQRTLIYEKRYLKFSSLSQRP